MRVAVCAMAKNEQLYIKDWVDHYLKLGFDKIYIFDNDEKDKPKELLIKNILPKNNRVEIFNIRGVNYERLQHDIYSHFYFQYNREFDWCFFCDIDEFLFGIKEIHSFLERPYFRTAKQIRVKWKLFGDDNLIERDMSKPVYEMFSHEIKKSLNKELNGKGDLENQGKMFVRGGLRNVVIRSPHFASFFKRENVIPSVLPSGRGCWSKIEIKENYRNETVYLHHYMTKSLSEFVIQKLNRTDAVFNNKIPLNYYWRINEKTPEKLEYLKNLGLE